jgi:hypothetical protein
MDDVGSATEVRFMGWIGVILQAGLIHLWPPCTAELLNSCLKVGWGRGLGKQRKVIVGTSFCPRGHLIKAIRTGQARWVECRDSQWSWVAFLPFCSRTRSCHLIFTVGTGPLPDAPLAPPYSA